MKQLLNLGNGALVINEDAGSIILELAEQISVGGGEAAGVIQVKGAGSVVLSGKQALHLVMKVLEAHSPAAIVPAEQAVEAIADAALSQA